VSFVADAADPAIVLLAWTYDGAKVFGHVVSLATIDLLYTALALLRACAYKSSAKHIIALVMSGMFS